MKYGTGDVRAAETTAIDISEFFTNPGGPVKFKIRHYSHYENNEINAMLIRGQSYKRGSEEVNIDKMHMAEVFVARMKAGAFVDEEFPFERWDEDFIKELDQRNPELTGRIIDAIVEFNAPLERQPRESSGG